ncbi:N-acetylglucosamine-6-phosphate deacetylase [Rubritalea marina]|uniref:N-acetylglucosamine-6-phosphate deacetylase n=1 Tax=Rubritalea marina TaxID=361055 RepID=UPI00035C86F4|nr:N-acetylglucosamine-6-phosphate deacetylase [Rubritalea marina]
MHTLIKNAHIVSPDLEILDGAISIHDGTITCVYQNGDVLPVADHVYDAVGMYAFPGFIDIHAHGANGYDVCDNSLVSIREIAKAKLAEGVTTWLPTTLTQAQSYLKSIAEKCSHYTKNQSFTKTPGIHLEGPFINASKAGAQNPEFVRQPDIEELAELHAITPALMISLAPCQDGASDIIRKAKQLGITSSAAHSEASYQQIRDAKHAGLTHLTHFGNAMTGLHHREIGMVGAGLIDDELKLELICDGIHLAPEFLKLVFKLKPIEHILLITDSMAGSMIENGECSLGGLEVIVNDNVARLKDSGALAGSTLVFNNGLKLAAEISELPLHQLVKASSWNQAKSLGLDGLGKIEVGFTGDIAILDSDFAVRATFVDGEQRF